MAGPVESAREALAPARLCLTHPCGLPGPGAAGTPFSHFSPQRSDGDSGS